MGSFLKAGAVFLALFTLVSPLGVLAAEGVEVKPAIIEDRVDPGSTHSFVLKVQNISDIERTFYLNTKDIKGIDEGGRPLFVSEGDPTIFNISSWITLPQESVTLGANEKRDIVFSVTVPHEASPGSHFGGIFLEAEPPRLRSTGAGVGVSVGSLINLQISGDIVEDARLRSFATGRLIYNTLPAQFETRVENLGNTLLRPTGFVEIVDMFGAEVANLRINESNAGVFPDSDRTFTVTWDKTGFTFGRYQAILSLIYGDDVRKTVSASTSFWVLPLKPILIILGSILGFMLVLYVGVRMHIQKKLREMGVSSKNKSQAALYAKQYQGPLSRTTLLVVVLLIFCVLFLGGLFFLLA